MDWQRLYEAVVLFTCCFSSVAILKKFHVGNIWLVCGWTAFFVLGLFSAILVAPHQSVALLQWSWLLILVFLIAALRQPSNTQEEWLDSAVLHIVLLSATAYVIWFWKLNADFYFSRADLGVERTIIFPGFANIRFFSDYQSFILLLLPTATAKLTSHKVAKAAGHLITGLFFTLALIVGSRSLVLAHFVLHLCLLALLGKKYWPFLFSQIKYWCFAICVFFFLTQVVPFLLALGEKAPGIESSYSLLRYQSSYRIELWTIAIDLIKHNMILGVGPLHFANFPNHIASSPHNYLLQIAVEWGIPAAVIALCIASYFVYGTLRSLYSMQNLEQHEVSLAISCAAVAILLQALVASSPLNYPVSQIIALICFSYPTLAAKSQETGPVLQLSVKAAGIIAILVTLTFFPSVSKIIERNQCYFYNPWPTLNFAPRFWQQGWLVGPCGASAS